MKGRTALLSLLAIALFAWFLSRANIADVWAQLRRADPMGLLAGFLCVVATYWLRALRWQHLLRPIGPTRFRTALRTTLIGFAALGVLPARIGDVLRPYLLARHEGLSVTATFATIVLERVLDLVAVLALMAVFVWGLADDATLPAAIRGPIEVSSMIAGIIAIGLLAVTWVFASHPERIGRFVEAATAVLPRKLGERLGASARTFSGGFAAARNPRALAAAIFWSFPLWIAIAAEIWFVTVAFGIAMPFTGSFLLQALLVIGVAVPTPGAVGSYHEAYRIGVTRFFHAPNDAAVAAAIVVHAIAFVPVVVAGFFVMAQDGLSLAGLRTLAGAAREQGAPPA